MISFAPYGPFEVPVTDGVPDRTLLNEFWQEVEETKPGLGSAIGCYVFAVRAGRGIRPWYVGKTDRTGFKAEVFQPHKLLLYGDVLRGRRRGTALLYYIARQTPSGRLMKKKATENKVISRLEEMMIGTSLLRNSNLANKKATKHFREMRVPGYMNESAGARSREAKQLARLLGVQRSTSRPSSQ